ncbi:YitT family protein [Shimazuella kribbensis]|uniref:YitT family protein n=1 Tax=Shimazuella kribbensis TaxID=139808 RepID=UPI00040777FB|nr:YitT family protein [Shimazuella kribbensis]
MDTTTHKQASWLILIKRVIFIVLGAVLVALSLEMLMVPNRVIDGGVVGISIMLSYLTDISLGLYLFILNLPFFIFGYKQIGKTFALSTLLGVGVMAIGTVLFAHQKPFTNDPLLAAIFGGIILGIGVGLVLRYGGSLDGTEILAIWITKRIPFSIGQIVMFFNLFILGSAGFVFGSWDRAMYSLIAYFIAFKTIDITIEGFNETKSVWIISDHYKVIGETILHRLGRGVTFLNGEGAYTGDEKRVIFCVVTRLEEAKLKSIVQEKDPEAFLAIGNIHDVHGGQFTKNDIH